MPIQIKLIDNLFCPVVICDHCQAVIDDDRQGNYEWAMGETGPVDGQIFYTHKACCRDFEEARGGRSRWYCSNLADLPIFLARNLNHPTGR